MTALVERPDLSQRTALSKSALDLFDMCQTKAWFSIHDPRPWEASERQSFGSAVDAGVEVILKYARSAQPVDLNHATAAAEEIIARDGAGVDIIEVQTALAAFLGSVLPHFDWEFCGLQSDITATIEGLGECNGHPDIILGDGSVFDVKTASRHKEVPSLELGFYALLMEEFNPSRKVPRVGYMTWLRLKNPMWQTEFVDVTDELRRWAYEKSAAYVRAKKADTALNVRAAIANNYSMTGSAKFPKVCGDCQYNPALGGPCRVSLQGEVPDVA